MGLLCNEVVDANFLTTVLFMVRPELRVDVMRTRDDLDKWMPEVTSETRLVAFCSSVVVPEDYIIRFSGPPYNFHPGHLGYPGKHPIPFAIYGGATTFGATLHEMAPRVDSGAIVGIVEFPVPSDVSYLWLMAKTHQATLHLFILTLSHYYT